MATRNANTMMAQMKLTDEAVGAIVANDGQGIITIDYFPQLNDKYVEGLCRFLRRSGGTLGGVSRTRVEVSAMDEANLEVMIYYIKHFKRIVRT